MGLTINFCIIIITLGGLFVGAELIVGSSVRIAQKIGISELVIGLTIVSFGTSAPEFSVSLLSAFEGHANISVSNVVGSNIFNLGFILGGIALIKPVNTSGSIVKRDGAVLICTTFLLLFFFLDLKLSTFEGVILFSILITYILCLFRYSKPEVSDNKNKKNYKWYLPLVLACGLFLIFISSHFLVDSSTKIARSFGVSDWVIGVTIIAFGTSLPELVTSLVAVIKGNHSLSAGNLIGSDIFNLLGVLGLTSILQPLSVSAEAYNSLILTIYVK